MRAFIRRALNAGKSPEHIIPEEVIGRRHHEPCPYHDDHDFEDCPTAIRTPRDLERCSWWWWGNGSAIRGETFEETMDEIRRRWGRTR